MKKLLTILAVAFFAAACEGPMGPQGPQGPTGQPGSVSKIVIDDIFMDPGTWSEFRVNGEVQFLFADIGMPEFTNSIINNGFFYTYYMYRDNQILVQEGTNLTIFVQEPDGYEWQYIIGCEYSVGNLRITLRTSDMMPWYPEERMSFRCVIFF